MSIHPSTLVTDFPCGSGSANAHAGKNTQTGDKDPGSRESHMHGMRDGSAFRSVTSRSGESQRWQNQTTPLPGR